MHLDMDVVVYNRLDHKIVDLLHNLIVSLDNADILEETIEYTLGYYD
jgi:hypothetical protein